MIRTVVCVWLALGLGGAGVRAAGCIVPGDLEYLGRFVVPEDPEGLMTYGGQALAYRPDGDPEGPADGFPGSLYYTGTDGSQPITEITIPTPARLGVESVERWPTASFILRDGKPLLSRILDRIHVDVHDIDGDGDRAETLALEELPLPVSGLEYVRGPAGGAVHLTLGHHIQGAGEYTHAITDPELSGLTGGPYILPRYTPYVTSDLLFELPPDWAAAHAPGALLVTGRFREGVWGGRGPALLAYTPMGEEGPLPPGLLPARAVTPLLLYGVQEEGADQITSDPTMQMRFYAPANQWTGGAWLTMGRGEARRGAVLLVGTRAVGACWYGFADGTRVGLSGVEHFPHPPPPPFPACDRGFWSSGVTQQALFYHPRDLARTAAGELALHEPQPYDALDLHAHLVEPAPDPGRYRRHLLGDCCFDRERGILYVAERIIGAVGDRSVIHVFRLVDGGTHTLTIACTGSGTVLPPPGELTVHGGCRIEARPGAGHYFEGWRVEGPADVHDAAAPLTSVRLTGPGELTATFRPIPEQATLQVRLEGEGTVTPTPGTHTVATGTAVALSVSPAPGFLFDRWAVTTRARLEASRDPTTSLVVTADATLTAHCTPVPERADLQVVVYPFTPEGPVGGTVTPHTVDDSGDPRPELQPTLQPVPIAATPARGYTFIEWRGTRHTRIVEPGARETTVTLTGCGTVAACFAPTRDALQLNMQADPPDAGTLTPPPGSCLKPRDEEIPIRARAREGYRFSHWSLSGGAIRGDDTDLASPDTYILLGEDATVTASFIRIDPPH